MEVRRVGYLNGWKEERERGNNVIIIKKLNARLEMFSRKYLLYINKDLSSYPSMHGKH